jgi:hypothetical protein
MPILMDTIDNIKEKEYHIVRINKSNLADIAGLHYAVYGTTVASNYFQKKYNTAYTGVENIGFIAYSKDNTVIAYYGVIPCFIQYEKTVILAAQSADTMTHPGYRYKGMFVELSNITFDLCKESGLLLIFGFPNQNSYHGAVNKLGWQITDTMIYYSITVNALPLQKLAKRSGFFNWWYKNYCALILNKKTVPLNGIRNSVLQDGFAGVYRDDDYLEYKSYHHTKVVVIAGAKIWINHKHGIMIGDMEGIDNTNFTVVIHKLKQLAKKLGIQQIQFHCSPGTSVQQLFARHYPGTDSYPVLFQDFGSAIAPQKIKFNFADIDIF